MHWLLIFYIWPAGAHPLQVIDFDSQEKCEIAGTKLMKQFRWPDKGQEEDTDQAFYYCVEK